MRHAFVAVVAAISVMAFPALAATTTGGNTPSTGNTPNAASQDAGQIRQTLSQDLAQAGYTDIRIIPGSFLVHAKDKAGHPIEMMISPSSVFEVTSIPSANANMKTSSNMGTSDNSGAPGTTGAAGTGATGHSSK